ncbi:hypothetical protein CB0940_12226 [Cercospora beticola]|uniref:Zn(2)-C6 fungal-type domain-containing protein n=1 Tax=Cercospora beticola TaxID=122368 RepID=A0A2G5GKR5_CERBT|nr:hypothetical protein CB0940_12226 [Cercospora beticola]PIA80870.1 hypothetical protein CB0940_12226 [Cercospora beticola]WPB08527.1 hypothetical protein RHO25_013193 [Cercospora beticola]CAK1356610.1 unnamed protein product [Cercospora beticola]
MSLDFYASGYHPHEHPSPGASGIVSHYRQLPAYGRSYYEPQHEPYFDRLCARAQTQEQDSGTVQSGSSRRRIQVACSRCRRHKIKCTGDPGDGSTCSACKSAKEDSCTFRRVGSHEVQLHDLHASSTDIGNGSWNTASYLNRRSDSSYHGSDGMQSDGRQRFTWSGHTDSDSYSASPVFASPAPMKHDRYPNDAPLVGSSNVSAVVFPPLNIGSMPLQLPMPAATEQSWPTYDALQHTIHSSTVLPPMRLSAPSHEPQASIDNPTSRRKPWSCSNAVVNGVASSGQAQSTGSGSTIPLGHVCETCGAPRQ